jgi:hypothetical protein
MTCLFVLMAAAIVNVAPVSAAQPQQPRDTAALKPRPGSAIIGGVVTTQDETPRPLRRVLVTLSGSAVTGSVQVATDDSGRFAFPELPAGRYTLTAEKPAHVKTYYGSKLVGRGPGTPIALAEGQRLTNLAIALLRGAVVEGTVFDENDMPLSSAQYQVYQPMIVNGERRLVNPPGSRWATTDDRGVYRLYGLPPGEYTVRAGGGSLMAETRLTTAAEIGAAVRDLKASSQGAALQPVSAAAPLVSRSGAYFPGVTDAALAEFFTLAAGQERTGVDLRCPLVRPTRLAGTAVGPAGQPLSSVMIGLANASTGGMYTSLGGIQAREDGRFSVTLTPGRYLFFGRGAESGRPGDPSLLPLWTSAEITVNEQDFLDLVLQFLPGTSVSGRLGFQGSQPAPDMTRLRITLGAVPAIAGTAVSPRPITPESDGSFGFTNVAPGRYRVSITGGGAWSLRSAVLNGRDTLDQPLDVLPGQDVSDVAVTLTDRPTEIAGTLLDQLGRPTPEYAIVVFSTDRAHWATAPRRVSGAVKAGSDGRFTVTGLPPGEYFLAVLTDPDPSQLRDPSFLEHLVASAIRVTLAEGEKKVQDVKLSGSGGD